MTTLFAGFGFTDYNADHRAIDNGKVYYQATSENYKNAISYFHKWFEEGLIDIEVFSQDSQPVYCKGQWRGCKTGRVHLVGNSRGCRK